MRGHMGHVHHDVLKDLLDTFCLSKAGLAIGSTKTGIAIAAPNGAGVDFCIDGVMYHKADAATAAITVHTAQAAGTTCYYGIQLSTAGAVSSVKGTDDGGLDTISWTNGTCPIGYLKVVTVGVTFTTGTDDLDATGVTTTYVDLCRVPASV